jgi:hypothetical protein
MNNKNPLNKELASLMNTLSDIMYRKGEIQRGRAYAKAEETILNSDNIYKVDELK